MTMFRRSTPLALLLFASIARAQSLPADTGATAPGVGFSLPRVGGSLNYGLSASELISTGFYNSDTTYSTNLSGDLGYISKSQNHPFSAVYDGGVLIGYSNQPTTVYQSLSFSQVFTTKNWNVSVADSVSYLPQSPVGGLSGVPGTGDLGVDPIAIGPTSGVGILTNYGPRVSNTLSGTVGRQITGKVSAQATGSYAIQRFVGDNSGLALNSTTEGGSVGLSYHFTPRDTLTGNYNYSNFSYTANSFSFAAQGATLEYYRKWSRRLVTDFYAGPQIINGSSTAIAGNAVTLAAGEAQATSVAARHIRSSTRGAQTTDQGCCPAPFPTASTEPRIANSAGTGPSPATWASRDRPACRISRFISSIAKASSSEARDRVASDATSRAS